jgi:threonine aldolase
MPKHFLTIAKQHGGLLAKGRLLGIQFDTLFTDNLYFEISRHAIDMAEEIKAGFLKRGYKLLKDSPTNQQFIILTNEELAKVQEKVRCEVWEKVDENHTAVRFASSWGTTKEQVEYLWEVIDQL